VEFFTAVCSFTPKSEIIEEEKDVKKDAKFMHFEEVIKRLKKKISGVTDYKVVYKD